MTANRKIASLTPVQLVVFVQPEFGSSFLSCLRCQRRILFAWALLVQEESLATVRGAICFGLEETLTWVESSWLAETLD